MGIGNMENYGQRQQKAWITMTLIVLNILYFVYLEAAGSSEDVLFMLEHGAMFGPLVLDGQEYYRLLTAVFMHFGINHIVNNMLVLFVLGDNLERALGNQVFDFLTDMRCGCQCCIDVFRHEAAEPCSQRRCIRSYFWCYRRFALCGAGKPGKTGGFKQQSVDYYDYIFPVFWFYKYGR